MKTKPINKILLFASILLASCTPTVSITQTAPASPTETSVPTQTPSPTFTLIPSLTPTPQPTNTPLPPNIPNGTMFWQWGWTYHWESTTSPYLVWGANLRDKMNGSCEGFICGGKDLRLYDPIVWIFLGRGEYGKTTFTFEEPLDTFVIDYKDVLGFDAFSGFTIVGKTVGYGYLADGQSSASYLDGSNFKAKTILDAEDKHLPVAEPCGIIDPNPNGDNSYNLTGGEGGIVWNFLDNPWGPNIYSTRKGYSLVSLTIIAQPIKNISPDQICP